jgi:multiple sugar transport system substrate-binding protein
VPTWEQVAGSIDTITEQASKGDLPADEAVNQMQSEAESIGTGL